MGVSRRDLAGSGAMCRALRPRGARSRRRAWLGGGLGLLLLVSAVLPAAASGSRPPYHPSRLRAVDGADQVVVVTSRSWSSSTARLRAYQRGSDGSWRLRLGPVPARLGANGFVPAASRRQSTGTTPAGTFAMPWAFGTAPDPGTSLDYRRVDGNDWWPYDPRDPQTYNVWQPRRGPAADWRPSWAEHLASYGRQYRHAVVLDFNLPSEVHRSGGEWRARQPADTRRGGGIFLHVNGRGATAGCVSVRGSHLRQLLRWLSPRRSPVVVMGPRAAITRM
jgi:L,D-peptidoglycan transpeptidase YkuD (ErfK/YbiS/YcfS/YnhG family)